MRIVYLEQRTDEWLAWREQGVTATDSPVILGRNPMKTPWRLWAEKVHFLRPVDLSHNPNVIYGIEHEDVARAIYEKRHDDIVLECCAEYDEDPVFRASFDGINGAGEPVEIKAPSDAVLDDVIANGRDSKAYQLYYPQVQHQILVAGSQKGTLVFYDGRRDTIIEFEILRDKSMIRDILFKGKAFYEAVKNRREPKKDPKRDLFIPTDSVADEWMQAAADITFYHQQITECENRMTGLKEELEAAKRRIEALMGENYWASYGGITVTRSQSIGKVNYKEMLEAHLGREPTDQECAPYRAPEFERWNFKVYDGPSEWISDEKTLNTIRSKTKPVEAGWF